jgi:predicted permease
MLMLLINLLGLSLPVFVLTVAETAANANGFLAMLMIGVGFRLELSDRKKLGAILKLLAVRYGLAVVFALCFYFLLPFGPEVRKALVILAFSPISSAVPGFTQELRGDVGLSSALNSIAMVISITITVLLLLFLV